MTIKPIKTKRDRQKGLKDVEKLWDAKPVLNKKRNLSVEMKRALHRADHRQVGEVKQRI